MGEIDAFLVAIDKDAVVRKPARRGPFNIFPNRESTTMGRSLSVGPGNSSVVEPRIIKRDATPLSQHISQDDAVDIVRPDYATDMRPSPGSVALHALFSAPYNEGLSMRHLSYSTFGDMEIDKLMHHYLFHVAELLIPVVQSQNPLRDVYFPAAVKGAVIRHIGLDNAKAQAHTALYHYILTTSAFHLWNCNQSGSKYQSIALQHRSLALQCLQDALNTAVQTANHAALLTAMLSLVTIGVS